MKKQTVIIIFIFSIIFLIGNPLVSKATEWTEWDKKPTVNEKNKSWTVTFNKPIDSDTVEYGETVFVIQNWKNPKLLQSSISIAKDQKSITVYAPKNGYDNGTYSLALKNIKSNSGEILVPTTMEFDVTPIKIKSLEDRIELPKTISIAENSVIRELKVKWNEDEIFFEDGFYKIKGNVTEINEDITMEIVLDELYLSNFFENLIPVLPPEEDEEDYRIAKMIEFLLKEVVKDPTSLVNREKLVQAHLKGAINQTTINVMMNEFLDRVVFDTTKPMEKEISACLSDAFSSHIFINITDTPAKYKKCVEKIFDYLDDTFGFDSTAITKSSFENITLPSHDRTFSNMTVALKNELYGMSGYWLLSDFHTNVKTLLQLEEDQDGGIIGYEYMLNFYEKKDVWKLKGKRVGNLIRLTTYISEDGFHRFMKSWSKKKYTYFGDYAYPQELTLDSKYYNGKRKIYHIYDTGEPQTKVYDDNTISMKRVPIPKLKNGIIGIGAKDEYDYLEELIKQ